MGVVTVRIAPPDVGGAARRPASTPARRAARTSSRRRSRRTSTRSTRCSPRRTGRAPPRRPRRPARGRRKSTPVPAGEAPTTRRGGARRGRRRDRHDRLVQPAGATGVTPPRRPLDSQDATCADGHDAPIAYAGEPGAFAEDAVLAAFGDVARTPLGSFRAVFEAVATGDAAAGVVPIENVIGGTVRENYDLLLEHDLDDPSARSSCRSGCASRRCPGSGSTTSSGSTRTSRRSARPRRSCGRGRGSC